HVSADGKLLATREIAPVRGRDYAVTAQSASILSAAGYPFSIERHTATTAAIGTLDLGPNQNYVVTAVAESPRGDALAVGGQLGKEIERALGNRRSQIDVDSVDGFVAVTAPPM